MLAELFPGLIDELGAAGAVVIDDGDLSRLYVRAGRYELQRAGTLTDPTAVTLCLATRPLWSPMCIDASRICPTCGFSRAMR